MGFLWSLGLGNPKIMIWSFFDNFLVICFGHLLWSFALVIGHLLWSFFGHFFVILGLVAHFLHMFCHFLVIFWSFIARVLRVPDLVALSFVIFWSLFGCFLAIVWSFFGRS